MIELDRIIDMIEWRIEPNRVVGKLNAFNCVCERAVKLRLSGFPIRDQNYQRTIAQLSIALDIMKDRFSDDLLPTLDLTHAPDPDAERPKATGARGGRPRKKSAKRKPGKAVGSSRSAD